MLKVLLLLLLSTSSLAVSITDGDDWSLPAWVQAKSDYVFFNEYSNPTLNINNHVIDLTWKQINPAQGVYSKTNTATWTEVTSGGSTFQFESYNDQLSLPGHYWLRIWLSGEQWLPQWVLADCNIPVTHRWLDHSQQDRHIPLWNPCVWNHAVTMYQNIFNVWGIKDDPNFEFAYVPGGFYYAEFDFDVMKAGFDDNAVTLSELLNWLSEIRSSLTTIMGDQSHKLVYTGQDYPFEFQNEMNGAFELHAADAVNAGMGIRNGITELFNFHLNETPAYGSHIQADGHVSIDESAPVHANNHVIGNENECFTDCGFNTNDPYYAIVMSNLKALQLRTTHLLVEPKASYMNEYSEHWNWVEKQLGKKVGNAADAWVALREYQDTFFIDNEPSNEVQWNGKPWLHNFERWLLQKDIAPDGMSQRGSDIRVNVLDSDNGTSYEGRRTNRNSNQDYLYFFVQDDFAFGNAANLQLKVTYLDTGTASWQFQYQNLLGQQEIQSVSNTNSQTIKTASFELAAINLNNAMTGSSDFRIYNGGINDIEIKFVRLLKLNSPSNDLIFKSSFD
jgi:hypothetical protein